VIAVRLAEVLSRYARTSGLGIAMGEASYRLARNPDTVRGPDLSFVGNDRVPGSGIPISFWPGAPDLVVEILSPDNRPSDVRAKLAQYFALGTRAVWVVDPDEKQIVVHDVPGITRSLGIGDTLDGGTLLPGFSCDVATIFAGLSQLHVGRGGLPVPFTEPAGRCPQVERRGDGLQVDAHRRVESSR
jgi:Uma2 family endonuclease